jgi:hypothetical protein
LNMSCFLVPYPLHQVGVKMYHCAPMFESYSGSTSLSPWKGPYTHCLLCTMKQVQRMLGIILHSKVKKPVYSTPSPFFMLLCLLWTQTVILYQAIVIGWKWTCGEHSVITFSRQLCEQKFSLVSSSPNFEAIYHPASHRWYNLIQNRIS